MNFHAWSVIGRAYNEGFPSRFGSWHLNAENEDLPAPATQTNRHRKPQRKKTRSLSSDGGYPCGKTNKSDGSDEAKLFIPSSPGRRASSFSPLAPPALTFARRCSNQLPGLPDQLQKIAGLKYRYVWGPICYGPLMSFEIFFDPGEAGGNTRPIRRFTPRRGVKPMLHWEGWSRTNY